jgi:hypothetical protein
VPEFTPAPAAVEFFSVASFSDTDFTCARLRPNVGGYLSLVVIAAQIFCRIYTGICGG